MRFGRARPCLAPEDPKAATPTPVPTDVDELAKLREEAGALRKELASLKTERKEDVKVAPTPAAKQEIAAASESTMHAVLERLKSVEAAIAKTPATVRLRWAPF